MKKTIEELEKEKELLQEKIKKQEKYDKLKKEVKDMKFKTTWYGKIKSKTSPKLRAIEKKVIPTIGKMFNNIGKNITTEFKSQEQTTNKNKKNKPSRTKLKKIRMVKQNDIFTSL